MELIYLILLLLVAFAVCVGVYFGVCKLISIWTGTDMEEAQMRLHNYLNGTVTYSISQDSSLADTLWANIKNVIGDKRFAQLTKLANSNIGAPLLNFGVYGGLPCISVCVYTINQQEKQIIETVLTNVVKSYLVRYGFSDELLVEWRVRDDLQMPYILIRYATNKNEQKLLNSIIVEKGKHIINSNSTLLDDTSEDELDG